MAARLKVAHNALPKQRQWVASMCRSGRSNWSKHESTWPYREAHGIAPKA